jgi:hypothetical protein
VHSLVATATANQKLALGIEKQATFSHGIQRKSKRDLEREQAKRKQDEEERSVLPPPLPSRPLSGPPLSAQRADGPRPMQ